MKQAETTPNKWLIFFLVGVGIFMSTLDGSIVNIALPAIMDDFLVPLSTVEWVMMIYFLTVSSLLLSFGRLSDIRGRRWVYSRGLVLFSLASLCCGMARSAGWLIAARTFQGVAAAMIMSCTPALLADAFPRSERGKAMGMMGAVTASGLTIGPALGGLILHHLSWRFIFYINIPIGIVTAGIVAGILKGGPADLIRNEAFDRRGALLLAGCFGPMLFAITHGHKWGYASLPILFCVCLSLISAIGLLWFESRICTPIFEPSLLKIRLFILPALATIFLFLSLFSMIFLMPFYLIHPCGFSVNQVGYIMVTPFAFLFVFSPVSGMVSDRIGSQILCTLGMGIVFAGLFALSRLSPAHTPFPILWRLALVGIGTAIFISPNNAIVMSAVPPAYLGVASGTVATARNLGMVLGIALAGTLFDRAFHSFSGGLSLKIYGPELEGAFMDAFRYAMFSGAVLAGMGAIVAFLRGKERIKQ